MEIVSAFISFARKSGVFVLVIVVLALIARVEPQKPPGPKRYPSMAKISKPKPKSTKPDPHGWFKGTGWRRNG